MCFVFVLAFTMVLVRARVGVVAIVDDDGVVCGFSQRGTILWQCGVGGLG